ncbi:MAG: hypothetical protein KDA92_12985, partial [Planctomycetales bacterium]|nr:hypothetical protein [Planctomycetales bacterium]
MSGGNHALDSTLGMRAAWPVGKLRFCWHVSFNLLLAIGCLPLLTSQLAAAPPEITDVSLRGLQIGGVTRVTLRGSGFDESLRLVLPVDPPARVVNESIKPDEAQLRIELAPQTSADLYPLRIATDGGISNAIACGIDALPQLSFRERLADLPVALHGTLTGAQVLHTEFVGTKGARIVIDAQSQRLGAKLRPVVRLFSPSQQHLGTARPVRELAGDARLIATLPEDGVYRIELQDIVFSGESPGWFRLLIGDFQVADHVVPLAVSRGVASTVQLIGSPASFKQSI